MKRKPRSLDKRLDIAWSRLIKLRDGMKCRYCDKTSYLNSHHIYSRSKRSVRWDTDNGICLCSGHHTLISSFSAHKTPLDFIDWLVEDVGNDFIDMLRTKAHQHKHWTKPEKEELLEDLENRILKYENNN